MAKVNLNNIAGSYASVAALNALFDIIAAGFENTLSLDGTTPNSMGADIDLNSNDLLNVASIFAQSFKDSSGNLVSLTDINTLGAVTGDMELLADIQDGTVATNAITTVAAISANVSTVAGIASDVTTAASISADITAVANDSIDIGTVSTNIVNVNTVATISGDVTTVVGLQSDMTAVIADATDIGTVSTNIANVNTVAGISGDVTTVVGLQSDMSAVIADATDIGAVAADLLGADTIGAAITSASNAATSASNAATSEANAASSASAASTSETNAATSASTATTQASAASGSAAAALASEDAALVSENTALGASSTSAASAATAVASASAALSSASQSATSAAASLSNRQLAETAKTAAELAQTGAETAESNAVAVVSGGTASLTPAAGLIPLANSEGKIADGWLAYTLFTDFESTGIDDNAASTILTVNATGIDVTGEITADGLALGDNDKATFGASDDLQIYHDGTDSYINDVGIGNLFLKGGGQIALKSPADENMIVATGNAGVQLFYDNVGKLLVTSTGIDVTGTATMDGLTVDGESTIKFDSGVGNANATLQLESTETQAIGSGASISFKGDDGTGAQRTFGVIKGSKTNATSANFSGGLDFFTRSTAEVNATKRLAINSNGDVLFYEDTGTTAKMVWDSSAESLGIGTTSPSASYSIDAAKGIRSSGAAPNITLQETDASNQSWLMGSYAGTFAVRDTTVSGTSYPFRIEAATPSSTLYLNSAGKVGIGTSSPSQALDVVGDIEVSGGVVFGDAGGTGSSSSNTLDSYEEGTWTPAISGGVVSTDGGNTYTKVGRLVTILMRFTVTTNSTLNLISGLPFAADTGVSKFQAAGIVITSSGIGLVTARVFNNGSFIYLYDNSSGFTGHPPTTSRSQYTLSFSYTTTA